ncbi:non-ribosomal peptide synthetase [Sphaerisporangium viridialbum]|uniref:non-ribosomal peptide synthetase n=1 Tax=Sphaerisporangium viridialbum TaxID=46189 RepID=UPI003C750723
MTSRAQDRAWFLDRLVPGSPAHNLSRAYLVTGELDVEALSAAWREVTRRHEILRTTLVEAGGRPAQEIAAVGGAAVPVTDLGTLDPPAGPRWCAEQAAMPFDLANGPLARLAVARQAPAEHRPAPTEHRPAAEHRHASSEQRPGGPVHAVVLVCHQAVADERSMSILVDEISACYAAAVAGRPAGDALPGPPRQYAGHAGRERDRASTPESRRLLDWWTEALSPAPAPQALPVDRARPLGPSSHGGVVRFSWGEELGDALAELCRAEGTTPMVALLAAFQCLLGRYGGEERPVVGVPATVRPGPEADDVVGPFANLLVLRADLSGRPAFRELLGRTARVVREAFEHRELPFDELVRALNVERDPYRIPLADVMFVFEDAPESGLRLPGATARRLRDHGGSARTDLTLVIERVDSSVTGSLEYRGSLFDPESARLILGQLHTLLAAALREPGLPVDALPLEGADRLQAAVREADLIEAAAPVDRPVHELVHLRARTDPDALAVVWDGNGLTYRELEERAAAVTRALAALGGVEGLPVAVRMSQGPRQVATLLGVLDAGAHLVCLGTGDAGERGRAVLGDIRPAVLVLDEEPADDELARWYRDELDGRILDLAVLDTALDTAVPDTDLPGTRPAAIDPVRSGVMAGRAYVAYTSGSTGRPKGIAQTHGSFAQFVTWFAGEFGMGPGSRVAQWAAPAYDASLVEIFSALVAGATLYPVPERTRANPERMAGWLAAEGITVYQTVPSFARQLLGAITADGRPGGLPALGHLLLAGEPLAGELANRLRAALPDLRLVNLYGPTESVLATWHEVTGPVYGVVPIGRPIPGRQILVLDEHDRPCPAGVAGQIVIRGPHITPGYVGAASGERSAFLPLNGFDDGRRSYRTGDLGRRRWDGSLEFGGRKDFQVKFNGARMELTDIEAALAAHESVAECAVVAIADADGLVRRLVGYVVPRTPGAAADSWRAALRRRFGKSMPPVSFKTLDRLPRNAGGKVDRAALPRPASSLARAPASPRTPVERDLAAIWSELLGTGPAEADVTFFAAGGHSLLVPVLLDRIHGRFGVAVSLAQFFADPTPAGLSALLESQAVTTEAITQTMMG